MNDGAIGGFGATILLAVWLLVLYIVEVCD